MDLSSEPLADADRERFGADPTASFAANLADVRRRIAAACARAGRDVAEIRLLPITKTVPASILRRAFTAGIDTMGENKIQEAMGKVELLRDLPITWSIVGHLQTNKAKYLARFAAEFHALDSLRLAAELNRRMEAEGRDLDVFVQVNTSGEASKFGLEPATAADFVARLPEFPRLKPRGLMTLALFSAEAERVRACFRLLHRKRGHEARLPWWALNVLGWRGAWSFGPALWSTLAMTRRMSGIGVSRS